MGGISPIKHELVRNHIPGMIKRIGRSIGEIEKIVETDEIGEIEEIEEIGEIGEIEVCRNCAGY